MWKPSVNAIWLRAASRFEASINIARRSRRQSTGLSRVESAQAALSPGSDTTPLVVPHGYPTDALMGERGSRPVHDCFRAILVRRKERKMHRRPRKLRLGSGHSASAEHLDDGGSAPDHRHRALVVVDERLRVLA